MSWADFSAFLAGNIDRSALRVTYDGGKLEIVSPGRTHEVFRAWARGEAARGEAAGGEAARGEAARGGACGS